MRQDFLDCCIFWQYPEAKWFAFCAHSLAVPGDTMIIVNRDKLTPALYPESNRNAEPRDNTTLFRST